MEISYIKLNLATTGFLKSSFTSLPEGSIVVHSSRNKGQHTHTVLFLKRLFVSPVRSNKDGTVERIVHCGEIVVECMCCQ